MSCGIFEKLCSTLRGRVVADEPLAAHTTWRVGGPADFYIVPADGKDLHLALQLLSAAGVPWKAVGGGSNLLARDGGFRGAIIDPCRLKELVFTEDGSVRAGAGLPLSRLIGESVERGLAGIEDLAGIPGTIGGAVAMNAGAGGQEIGKVVRTVTLAGPAGFEEWPAGRLQFGYRHAVLPDRSVVTGAVLQLSPDDAGQLAHRMRQRIDRRRQAQRIEGANAGSVFKNPPEGSAWKLIEDAGLRGAWEGGAQVAEGHANFIVNHGNATARDIELLIARVRDAVRMDCGVVLETEVRVIGQAR